LEWKWFDVVCGVVVKGSVSQKFVLEKCLAKKKDINIGR